MQLGSPPFLVTLPHVLRDCVGSSTVAHGRDSSVIGKVITSTPRRSSRKMHQNSTSSTEGLESEIISRIRQRINLAALIS